MRLLFLAPALGFGLLALVSSALALRGDPMSNREQVIRRSRLATQVAAVAAILCALSLLVGTAYFVLNTFQFD